MRRNTFLITCLLVSISLLGQDSLKIKETKPDPWNFRIGPYFWLININASLEKPPVPSNLPEYSDRSYTIDKPFSEIKNSIKFAFLINADYQNNRWLGLITLTSFILEGEAITPKELLVEDLTYRLELVYGEALAGYQIVSKPKFKIDMFGGAKMFYSGLSGKGDFVGGNTFNEAKTVTWIEPILASRLKYQLHKRIEIVAYLDYGPIRTSEELTNQYSLTANFLLNKWLYIAPGYRYWLFRTNRNESVFNGQFYGFFFRIGGQF